jgi:hypothetical protein
MYEYTYSHIIYVNKKDWTFFFSFHTNVLVIKPPQHFVKQYDTKCI